MPDLAEIVRRHGPEYLARFGDTMPKSHRRALEAIERCRTPANGGHRYLCAECGRGHYGFHSCNHRACPQCGGAEAKEWLEGQCARLLPAPYFMVTFTLPAELRDLCRSNQELFYKVLFNESAGALKEVAAERKHLGAELGFLGVLHTWTRQLHYHPHVHYIVPGGGLREDGSKWRKCRRVRNNEPYLLPVRVLSARYRDRCRERLKAGAPDLYADIPESTWERDWVVHSLHVGGGLQALMYLSAYVLRTALSNKRLLSDQDGVITFGYTESGTNLRKTCALPEQEFLRRYLQHVLPSGCHKVRYFGWLHPRAGKRFLRVQSLLAVPLILGLRAAPGPALHLKCPHCGKHALQPVARIRRCKESLEKRPRGRAPPFKPP